ncbi:MAG: DUF4179 domain-containing protein [Clostridia bacterium]
MFREKYRSLNNQIKPDEKLISNTIAAIQKDEQKSNYRAVSWRKKAIAFAAICLCITIATPVLAANAQSIYRLMYMVSPTVAQFFLPVQKTDEDNGIKMEVISAYIHDNTAEIYITMQDLTGNRIDSTTDLYDSYSINRPFDSSAHCELMGYAGDTKTATFLVTINEWGNKDISGDKITFSVREFLSHKKNYDDIRVPLDLSALSTVKNTQKVRLNGGSGVDFESDAVAIAPATPISAFKVAGIDLTGIGYIDGKLHIQTAVNEPLDNDNHGFFHLKNSRGERIDCSANFSFSNQHTTSGRTEYYEYVFDIPQDEISKYTLHGDFVTSEMKTKANLQVTFPLENKK